MNSKFHGYSEPGAEPLEGGVVDYYVADVVSQSDYYPGGLMMPNRNDPGGNDYRYGFNGMEDDEEMTDGNGQSYDFGARFYNPRVGKWLSRDPKEMSYPNMSPYSYANNNPIFYIDFEGGDPLPFEEGDYFVFNGESLFLISKTGDIKWQVEARSGNGPFINNPNATHMPMSEDHSASGAIPKGLYFIELDDFVSDDGQGMKDEEGKEQKGYMTNRKTGGWGRWTKPLKPSYWTDDYGRTGFFLHEDGNEDQPGGFGSGGCIAISKSSNGILIIAETMEKIYNDFGEGTEVPFVVNYTFNKTVYIVNVPVDNNDGKLKFRTAPKRLEGNVIAELPTGTLLIATGNKKNGYVQVTAYWKIDGEEHNKTGWVSKDYVKKRESKTPPNQ